MAKLDVSTRNSKVFGKHARNYRQSDNIEDRRDGRGEIRANTDMYGRPHMGKSEGGKYYSDAGTPGWDSMGVSKQKDTSRPNRGRDVDTNTPDDDSADNPSNIMHGGRQTTTPSNTRKVDAEEAVRKTHYERR